MTEAIQLGGMEIKLMRSDYLPEKTMVVSPDLYDLLANNGEAAERARMETLHRIAQVSDMVRAYTKVQP